MLLRDKGTGSSMPAKRGLSSSSARVRVAQGGARPRRENLESAIAARFPFTRTETKTRPDGTTYRVEVSMEALPRGPGRPVRPSR